MHIYFYFTDAIFRRTAERKALERHQGNSVEAEKTPGDEIWQDTPGTLHNAARARTWEPL